MVLAIVFTVFYSIMSMTVMMMIPFHFLIK